VRIRFWGTRGSLARPGPSTIRYGGNTPCVEVRSPDGTLIVLDCGTGAHDLGQHIVGTGGSPARGHLLITHTHWDHIQGFPFFAPLFVPGSEWDVYAPHGLGQRLEATLAGQMEYAYFPIALDQLGAKTRYHDLTEGVFDLGNVRVTTRYLNHPRIALGYRLEVDGVTLVYATDHEPHSPHHPGGGVSGRAAHLPVHKEDQRHIEFLAGADLLIHDAQYTLEEYPQKLSWGHSPAELAVDFAVAGGVRRLALFHHDPLRTDDALDRLVTTCRQHAADAGDHLEVFAAAEGQVIELMGRAAAPSVTVPAASVPIIDPAHPPGATTILVADDDPDIIRLLTMTLRPEGFRLISAYDGETTLAIARRERPDLILMDWNMPERNGIEVCRTLRADADPRLRDVPIVLLTARARPEDTAAGFAAGATDYLTKPFKPAYLRSRVQTWLLRRRG
jgi:CheY-like chemotaxis protein/phosphoribosyl 1,2-cyclic phosphodiesterase